LTGTVAPTNGGTGVNTVTTGDLLYGSASNTWSKLAAGSAYRSLTMNAAGTNVEWNAVSLNQANAVSGTLGATNGGTGQSGYATGDTLYSSATNTLAKLSGNTTTTPKYLRQVGTGSASQAPTWDTLAASDITSGTLAVARGGTNIGSYTTGDLIYASGTTTLATLADAATGNVLLSGGAGVAPAYGKVVFGTHTSGTLATANGGTGVTTNPTVGGITYGVSSSSLGYSAAGTTGQVLLSGGSGAPTWSNLSSIGVTSFSAGTTGFTPSTATSGVVTLAGTLNVSNGGTGLTSLTAGRIPFGAGTSAFGNTDNLFWDSANARLGVGTTTPLGRVAVNGGTLNTTTYTSSEARISDGAIHLMKTVIGGVFEAVRAMNLDTTAGTTVRLLGAATSDPFNNTNGGKVFVDAIRTATNMDFAISLNDTAGAAPVERLRLTGAGNLGLGVTPSAWGSGYKAVQIGDQGSLSYSANSLVTSTNAYRDATNWKYLTTRFAPIYEINSGLGYHAWYTTPSGTAGNAITFTQAMTLDAGGRLLVGGTSSYNANSRLQVTSFNVGVDNGAGGQAILAITADAFAANAGASLGLGGKNSGGSNVAFGAIAGRSEGSGNAGYLQFATLNSGGTMSERMRIDSSGNLGLGVTPSAWGSTYRAAEVRTSAVYDDLGTLGGLTFNASYNGTNWVYKGTGGNAAALRYEQNGAGGGHRWFTAPSGTAGATISFTQAMTLDASGNVQIGTTTSNSARLRVVGSSTSSVVAISNTSSFAGGANFTSPHLFISSGTDTAGDTTRLAMAVGSGAQVYLDAVNVGGAGAGSNLLIYTRVNGGGMAERMRVTDAGNVGIATSSPRFKLSIGATTSLDTATPDTIDLGGTFSSVAGTNPKLRVWYDGTQSAGLGISANQLNYITTASFSHVWYSNGSERMRIDTSGNVGIGTASPGSRLAMFGGTGNTHGIQLYASGWNTIGRVGNNGTSGGDLILSENWNANANTVDSGVNATAYVNVSATSGSVIFGTGNTGVVPAERFRIGTAGQLGIGGANYGTSGQALVSNGSGSAPSWQTVSSNKTTFGLYENASVISANYTITTNNNAISAGPITVNSGVTVTVPSGSTWTVT
jgi:hypothetical protein